MGMYRPPRHDLKYLPEPRVATAVKRLVQTVVVNGWLEPSWMGCASTVQIAAKSSEEVKTSLVRI